MIGLDTGLIRSGSGGRRGRQITPGFRERFGTAYDIEFQRWVDAVRQGTIDGPGAWDGYASAAVCEAGVEALKSGRRTEVALADRAAASLEPSAR
jgi:myo-inositol 2-dehydrogenase/D-chiro-inositol 1-dehydrogenase